uniref:Saccharopine dehydrogenase-like oxidoreductase n=1 Tax=Sinocyclocheilus anshuiensis TaxID=1608454 RepID=A0A671PXR0_9TELE
IRNTNVSTKRLYFPIVFGATGFTAQFVVEEVARTSGRNRDRLEIHLSLTFHHLSAGKPELKCVEVIVTDVTETESLAIMCKQGVIVLNCVGPYRFYGETVMKACIENVAHCIDILTQIFLILDFFFCLFFFVFELPHCGFDSIPADMGIISKVGFGHGFADSASLRRQRKKFGHKPLPVVGTRIKKRGALFFSKEIEQYAVPVMGSDPSVVDILFYVIFFLNWFPLCSCPQVKYMAYVGIGGLFSVLKTLFAGVVFWFMVKFRVDRGLLTQFPEFFSFGLFSKTGPTRKPFCHCCLIPPDEWTSFCLRFMGEVYTTGQDKPNATVSTEITSILSVICVECVTSCLTHCPFIGPRWGGLYTPGSAFARTTLIDHLNKHGIHVIAINE